MSSGSKNRGEWACSLKSCSIKYAWKSYVPAADTHGKDFLEAVDGTGDSETVWKHSKIFESWIWVTEKWNRLISESCLISLERRSKICQAKGQIINGYNTRQDTENFPDTYGLCAQALVAIAWVVIPENTTSFLLEWHGRILKGKLQGFGLVCGFDKPMGVGHQDDGNRSK